ncbi:MAG TPA: hypothetical protein DCL43_11130 [Chitinophagaceae bacterium]|nr:hypothetical protein [Chitinophagaceae bacterium]HAN38715.1 hypothetical protein [Chitinophagaceae bacterium]
MRYTILLLILCVSGQLTTVTAQTNTASLLQNKRFQFSPAIVYPLTGKSRNVAGSGYFLQLRSDTLSLYLPYFGKSFSSFSNAFTKGGAFDETHIKNFTYTLQQNVKSSTINIAIQQGDVAKIIMTIYANGTADVSLQSNSRQPIRYFGQIGAVPIKRKLK